MRIVLCIGWYFPESVGGTEVCARALGAELTRLGHSVVVMAPIDGEEGSEYWHDGLRVLRYPVPIERTHAAHAGDEPHGRFEEFEALLRGLSADVFHLHSITYGAGLHHLLAARRLGMRTLTTMHLPGALCERGALVRFGREACDGLIDPAQCVPCWLESKGLPEILARGVAPAIGALPRALVRALPGRLRTVASTHERVQDRARGLHALAAASDWMVVVCQWLLDALAMNGVDPRKLVLSRQGVDIEPATAQWRPAHEPGLLRMGFLGRWDPLKGLHMLVRALVGVPRLPRVELHVHTPQPLQTQEPYRRQVMALAGNDERFVWHGPAPHARLIEGLRRYDVIAIPSQFWETGPMVAKEALAVGVPVLGSALGGIAEIVQDGVNGWLMPSRDVQAWRERITEFARDGVPDLPFRVDTSRVPSTREVARQMLALYARIARAEASAPVPAS